MKKIRSPFKAIFSLGGLGGILLLLAGAMLWALISQASDPYDGAQERMVTLNILENDLTQTLNEMKLQEAHKIFLLEYELPDDPPESKDSAQLAEDSNTQIGVLLANLEEEGHFDTSLHGYLSDIQSERKTFDDLRASHRQTFTTLIQAYAAEDPETRYNLMNQLETEHEDLDTALRDITVAVEQDRLQAQRDFPEDINLSILYATSGLALSLLLGLAGYQLIASAVRPLRSLRNTITAMEGDQYRPELQAGLLKKRGPAGQLARALDQLASAVQQRDATLKAEIERQRQALYESRRRRLKISHETLAGGEKS